ncbi:MAG: NAD-dependent epimerase/dehydratase family protein [Actinobacteria bacterium]|nr:NAD-dependent epimerase/dehydratase family protein [Actinomycetota bacterium]
MRVVVTGATGNVGASLVRALGDDDAVTSIVGLARRAPKWQPAKTSWVAADVSTDDLAGSFEGADAVVHLAWLIQPSRQADLLWRTNVAGSRRVFHAAARAGVGTIVYASSVGAYSPGPKDRRVDEGWPVMGVPTSFYSRHKAEVERSLDAFEAQHPGIRVVRLRPGLLFKRASATEQRRLFAGPFVPVSLVRRELIPFVPDVEGLRFQALHTDDVADAYRRALTRDVRGAFNLAAEPILDPRELGRILHAKPLKVSPGLLRGLVNATWRMHLQPTPPGWLDMGRSVPIMDTARARDEFGWSPRYSSSQAVMELLEGMRAEAGTPTPPLDPATSGRGRVREMLTGMGRRSGL